MSERAALSARAIPFMELSNGTDTSLTAPPPPLPHYLNAEGRAMARFAVEGNAVITGGAGTLALAAARALLEHGLANVFLFDLRSTFDASDDAIQALHNDFPSSKVIIETVDVTDAENVDRAFAAVATRGSIDILLCFAGVVGCLHAIEMTPEQWRRTIDINTTGSFLCAQAAAKQMQHQGTGGSIVFTASISGHRVNFPQPQAAYNVSKAAVIAMKDSLAAEWARYGIRVNSISPGYMDTVLNEGAGLEEARNIWAMFLLQRDSSSNARLSCGIMLPDLSLSHDSSSGTPQPQFPSFSAFQRLPTELRILICKNAVTSSKPIDLSKRVNQRLPEVTRVSKFFHTEGNKFYYRENVFLLPLPSRLTHEENLHLDQWLCNPANTELCKKMSEIVVQVSLPPDRSSLANLILLATHFQDKSSKEARKTLKLQSFITVPAELEPIMPTPPVATEIESRISEAFWNVFDGSLHDLARGTYKIDWVDEEEMEMNAGVPLLERSVALGRICEELWLAIMSVWASDS
ncbi:NAD(P)-binding protein, partial [Aureobasidium melanogenum]